MGARALRRGAVQSFLAAALIRIASVSLTNVPAAGQRHAPVLIERA
jgi:hypothetical protein